MKNLKFYYKFKNKIYKIIIHILKGITINKLLKQVLKETENCERNYFKLIKQGHVISGYVPFIPNKTRIIIYNFLAENYGLRGNLKVEIGILDSKFTAIEGHQNDQRNRYHHRIKSRWYRSYRNKYRFAFF